MKNNNGIFTIRSFYPTKKNITLKYGKQIFNITTIYLNYFKINILTHLNFIRQT